LLYSVYLEHQPIDSYDYSVRFSHLNNFRSDHDYNSRMNDWYEGIANRFDFQNNFHIHDFDVISVGFDYVREFSDSYFDSGSAASDESKVFDWNAAFYLQNKLHYEDLMGSTQSMRVDHHNAFGTHTTYKIDGFFMAPTRTRLRGAASTSFKAPSLYQLYAPANPAWLFLGGNTSLKPETARAYELGVDQYLLGGRVRLGVTYFQTRFGDLIKYQTDPVTWVSTYQNAAKAKSLGTEWEVECELVKKTLTATAGMTFMSTKDYSTDNELLRVPSEQMRLIVNLTPGEKFSLRAGVTYTGISLSSGTDKLKPYTLVDLTAEYKIVEHWSVYMKLNNALDRHYQQVRGYGMPGFGAYGGIKASY